MSGDTYLANRWAEFGEQLASHLSAGDVRVIPLRLAPEARRPAERLVAQSGHPRLRFMR